MGGCQSGAGVKANVPRSRLTKSTGTPSAARSSSRRGHQSVRLTSTTRSTCGCNANQAEARRASRFEAMGRRLQGQGRPLRAFDLAAMEEAWAAVKREEVKG